MTTHTSDDAPPPDPLTARLSALAAELRVDPAPLTPWLAEGATEHQRMIRVAVPGSADALELMTYRAGGFDGAEVEAFALRAGVSPEQLPPIASLATAHPIRGLYRGVRLARGAAPTLTFLVDASWRGWGLLDALARLGVSEGARDHLREVAERGAEPASYLLGVTVSADGACSIQGTAVLRFFSPTQLDAIGGGLRGVLGALELGEGAEAFVDDWLPRLRPGPSHHDLLVTYHLDSMDAGRLAPRLDLEFVALPTWVALDALEALGYDVSLGELVALTEALLVVPEDPSGVRWVDGLRLRLGRGPSPEAELAWFTRAERFVADDPAPV